MSTIITMKAITVITTTEIVAITVITTTEIVAITVTIAMIRYLGRSFHGLTRSPCEL